MCFGNSHTLNPFQEKMKHFSKTKCWLFHSHRTLSDIKHPRRKPKRVLKAFRLWGGKIQNQPQAKLTTNLKHPNQLVGKAETAKSMLRKEIILLFKPITINN